MKLKFNAYRTKFNKFTLMFDLLHHALEELGKEGFRRFMEKAREPRKRGFTTALNILSPQPDDSSWISDLTRSHEKRMSKDLPITPSLKWHEYKGEAYLGLYASELVLRLALFEAFMKDIHRHALMSKPDLLTRTKPSRTVTLKNLFQKDFLRFQCDEINRQVREADRLCVKERAKFFDKVLKLPWADIKSIKATVEDVDNLTKLRHTLVHARPDCPVTYKNVESARRIFHSVPSYCFERACVVYPSHFQEKYSRSR